MLHRIETLDSLFRVLCSVREDGEKRCENKNLRGDAPLTSRRQSERLEQADVRDT